MSKRRTLEWVLVASLATFAFINSLCWANVVPLGQAPDEAGHFEVVAFETVFRRIPEFGVDDYGAAARVAVDGYRTPYYAYSAQPGLSYILSAATVLMLDPGMKDPARTARYPGALWAALLTLVTYLGARAMFDDAAGVAVLAATLVSTWPQLALVFSYVNNDGLTTLVCTSLIASVFVGRKAQWTNRHVLALGTLCGFALLGKPNGYFVVGVAFLALGLESAQRWQKLALGVLAASATAGWWYAIAVARYGRDIFASARAEQMREALGVEWPSGRFFGLGLFETAFGEFPRYGEPWIVGSLRSAVGVLGQMTVHLQPASYVLAGALTAVGIGGACFVWLSCRPIRFDLVHVATLLLLPGLLWVSLYRSWSHDYQAQGRYLFPAILPFAVVVAYGIVKPFRGPARGATGFASTVMLFGILVDAFAVRLLRLYDQTFGDFFDSSPFLASLWVASLVSALSLAVLYWLRMAGENGASNPVA